LDAELFTQNLSKGPLLCALKRFRLFGFPLEISMATVSQVSLSRMNVESLMDLRKRVDERLLECRSQIEKQLERIDWLTPVVGGERGGRRGRRTSALKGRKVAPKYRSPSGKTWAGRGARPRWLVDAMKGGKKLNNFLIDKSAKRGGKRRSKR
jgi:DNA-binding protein H-NS